MLMVYIILSSIIYKASILADKPINLEILLLVKILIEFHFKCLFVCFHF
jgi:hypothetical protein